MTARRLFCILLLVAPQAFFLRAETVWKITVMGRPGDSRVAAVAEAVDFWNARLVQLGSRERIGSISVVENPVPDEVLNDMSLAVARGRRIRDLAPWVEPRDDEFVVVLANDDLMSFAVPGRNGAGGVAVLRRGDDEPLSLPNVARNVAAHEIGHLLGLPHNDLPGTLMCGRPAQCRPDLYFSETPRFFPLTAADEKALRPPRAE